MPPPRATSKQQTRSQEFDAPTRESGNHAMGSPLPASKLARTCLKLATSHSLVRRALFRQPSRLHLTTTAPQPLVSVSHAPWTPSPPKVVFPACRDIHRRIRRPPWVSQVKSRATEPAGLDAPGSLTKSLRKSTGRGCILDLAPRTCAKIATPSVDLSLPLTPGHLASPVCCHPTPSCVDRL
jgi:hypothetical protein